eukprot:5119786-Pleurochrysis_carterae.AAC.2
MGSPDSQVATLAKSHAEDLMESARSTPNSYDLYCTASAWRCLPSAGPKHATQILVPVVHGYLKPRADTCSPQRDREPARRCIEVTASDSPSSPPAASAKRSLRAAIDGPPDRPDPGRVQGNGAGPIRLDSNPPSSIHGHEINSSKWLPCL